MKQSQFFIIITLAAALIFLTCPILADTGTQQVLYQTSFATNPQWTTNNPSSDYWDQSKEMYHFRIEPSTGNYAYTPAINYESGSFTLGYDVTLEQVDDGATFRLGFSGKNMDRNKGPNIVTEFTNAKYGQIMWLHIITQSAKLEEVNSDSSSYPGPTAKYSLNTTYHIKVDYNDDNNVVTMTVSDKTTGTQLWSYYINTLESFKDMNRIYIGSVGDYGPTSTYATGWIDNVALTTTVPAAPTTATTQPTTPLPTYTRHPVTSATTTVALTHFPTTTQKSPSSGMLAITALGIIGICSLVVSIKKKR